MYKNRILPLLLSAAMILPVFPSKLASAADDRTHRSVYLHAQGENPDSTTNGSTVYMGDTADIYFAVDNPNKGGYENGVHTEPQYDMNGYTVRICFDPEYFDIAADNKASPIDYTVPGTNINTSDKSDEIIGDDVGVDVPQEIGYFVYKSGSGTYDTGGKTYRTAYLTVFFSGGYLPQKNDDKLWYNLAKLPLTPKKTGSTDVFVDIDSGDELYTLELFAKNKSENLNEQTFTYDAVNGGYHNILIKDKTKPAPPSADPTSGSYVEQQTVTLSQDEGCKIFYTLDGSDPKTSASKIEYTQPIDINITTELKACAYRDSDDKYSNTVTYNYKILPDRPYLFDTNKNLISDFYSEYSNFSVYASDKNIFGDISAESEVYYTFGNADAENPVIGSDPETEWVKIDKRNPVIDIDKTCTLRLITDKMGELSEPAVYFLSIKPAAVEANYPSGDYEGKIDVTLSTKTKDAAIYYTIDGSDPKSSPTAQEYVGIPITIAKDCTIRAAAIYDDEWSDKTSWYYIFKTYDDYGINAFYPSGVYEGSVNVTLTPNNPNFTVKYHTGDGVWKDYDDTIVLDKDTVITAKAVDENGNEGEEYVFTYRIKPLPPIFAPESTQFTNANMITIYTPESTKDNTTRYELYYTLDGSDPLSSQTRMKADDDSDSAIINITKYTVVTAAVLKDGESWSTVVKHSYDIVTKKPVRPITTLTPGYYIREIGGEGFVTQFMPVPKNTTIYYTVRYDGTLCPDPVPNTENTYKYDGISEIEVKGKTVIKAVAVNVFGVKSDVGIFSYTVTPKAPVAAPSAVISANKLPVVPVHAVVGATVKYTLGDFENEFVNSDDEMFYIDTHTGNAYRDKACTIPLGNSSEFKNTDKAVLEISAELDGVESDINRYVYSLSDKSGVLASPYADKDTGTYKEKKIDEDNNILSVSLFSLNEGGSIQYRFGNYGEWITYDDTKPVLLKQDTIMQLRYEKNGSYSAVTSYVYNFVPLEPVIELPSGTYLESDNKTTKLFLSDDAPTDKNYSIWYRQNGDAQDFRYTGQERAITHTMSFKAYVKNEDTGKISANTIHYYVIETAGAVSGSVYIAHPYDTERISADLLATEEYAEGIKLLTQNKNADIYYYYTYTKKTDGQTITTNSERYDITRPIIPTSLMDDITIYAWLEDENGRIPDSNGVFTIDFVHLNVPVTSLGSDKIEFPKGTKYKLINEYGDDKNIFVYYTLDGSSPEKAENTARKLYSGEELSLDAATTVKAVYYSVCGKCVECKNNNPSGCWYGVYGKTGTYMYTVPITIHTGGGGGGGGGSSSQNTGSKPTSPTEPPEDNSRKHTEDIFGNTHLSHIGYIDGYPDGSVQPEGDITREEMTAILYRITNHSYEKPFVPTGDVFPDVNQDRWSAHDIEYMTEKDVIYGYPDGEFKPSRHLTRAEFAALIYRFTEENLIKGETENIFSDLSSEHWAYNEILTLYKNGLMEGYEDTTIRPESNITRAEVMTVINKILGRKPLESYVKTLDLNPYNDLEKNKWYYVIVLEATITHDYYLDDNEGYEYKWENWK